MRFILIILMLWCSMGHAENYRITKSEAWRATSVEDAIFQLYGAQQTRGDNRVLISAPKLASNGGMIPLQVETSIKAKSIAILQDVNPSSLVTVFSIFPGSIPKYALRLKMISSGNIVVVVEGLDGVLYSNSYHVEVALGGCEGGGDSYYPASAKRKVRIPYKRMQQEAYSVINEKGFRQTSLSPLSTFSTDVDTASYANIRRYVFDTKRLPPKDAVRIEEMINYFDYDYAMPTGEEPFAIHTRVGKTLWNSKTKLIQIGLQTKKLAIKKLPESNLVFLLDVSGSMNRANKLPLLTKSLALLVRQLRREDRVSIVVYAGSSGLVLDRARGDEKDKILNALRSLRAGGSTAGASGIYQAYEVAQKAFIKGGNNRVILATDGDFNVGQTSQRELTELIESKRKSGIYLSVLGFGTGNYKDDRMERLSNQGNGNYAYIDSLLEAKKVLVTQMSGTLYTVAKDVKIQVEFNPLKVKRYRLIGYENRLLKSEDFKNDKVDAAEVGMGHSVTALYEVELSDTNMTYDNGLKYQKSVLSDSNELATVKIRYKLPKSDSSVEMQKNIEVGDGDISVEDFGFVQIVAGFGMLLRDSAYKHTLNYATLVTEAKKYKGKDDEGYRAEMIKMMESVSLY